MSAEFFDVYQACVDAGLEIDNHESDLYVRVTPESAAIIKQSGYSFTVFTSQIDGKPWYDVPFAFLPWWERRQSRGSAGK